jgi:EAL domain-containing protein (putative c-di-GMP-specific phosphodiesterase class I)
VAVNLSPAQFESGSIENAVAEALQSSGLKPHRLELEITETLLLGNTEATMAMLKRLKDMGVSIVMDDFGTGYSSLSYLWKFPFDKIKIDRSFMESFEKSGRDVETVVKTIIALGREMNMRVTGRRRRDPAAGRLSLRRRRRSGAGLLFRQAGACRRNQC